GVSALAVSENLSRVRCLCLRHNDVGDIGAVALAASPYLGELQWLTVSNNRVTDAGAAALLDSEHLNDGMTLWIDTCPLSDTMRERLARRFRVSAMKSAL